MKNKKNSSLSKKFIISIGLVYAILIITTAISFKLIINSNSLQLKNILISNNNYIILEKTNILLNKLRNKKFNKTLGVIKFLKFECNNDTDFFYNVIIYKKTSDENYFRIIKRLPVNKNLVFMFDKKKDIVKEKKGINYLKKGLLNSIVEPKVYSKNNLYWQNVYFPFKIKKRKYVVQLMASAAKISHLLFNYNSSTKKIIKIMMIFIVILIISVTIITVIFIQNYSLLIKNLSIYIDKAAKGDLDINIKTTDDKDLNELAHSFNSLIDELKDKSGKEPVSGIFQLGVSSLKNNNIDDSISIFRTLSIINPESFGSFFNLGVSYAKKKQYLLSLEMFTKSMEINPDHELTAKYIGKVKKLLSIYG